MTMKTTINLLIIILLSALNTGCQNKANKVNSGNANPSDTSAVADSLVQTFSGTRLVKEVPYKNGKRQGLMKTYTPGGLLYQTFWYKNGLREDTARWYFEDGKVFRTTPFKNDSANGIQTQYYRNGRVRAKLSFVNGLRTPYLEEFGSDGKKIGDYPDLVVKTKDEYNQNGTFKIYLELTNKSVKTNYYRGEYLDGLFNPKKYIKLNNTETTGYLELKKSPNPGNNYIGVIAEISTSLGNRYLIYKKIELPHNYLK